MKNFLRKALLIFLGTILLFSCSDNKDQRAQTRKALGEPDQIITQNMYSYQTEYWVYARSDINTVYEFSKSASGCGGSGEWYLGSRYYADYHFGYSLWDPPPTITHTPITLAPPDRGISISATVKLYKKAVVDKQVQEVDLYYRTYGDSLASFVVMACEDSSTGLYTGEIPAMNVTTAGAEYYIKATSDNTHWSYMPKTTGTYFLISVSDTVKYAQKSPKIFTNYQETPKLTFPVKEISTGGVSPLSQ
jgi:hypothetical protein